jgi:DNA-binding response OmpR family regulator
LPILLSSGYSELEVVNEADHGETAYLPKPYTLDELKHRIQAMRRPPESNDPDWLD